MALRYITCIIIGILLGHIIQVIRELNEDVLEKNELYEIEYVGNDNEILRYKFRFLGVDYFMDNNDNYKLIDTGDLKSITKVSHRWLV